VRFGPGLRSGPPRQARQPEKRTVGSSTLPLTTSFGQVSSALISANADPALSYPQPSSDHDYPCVTVVGRSLSHADRTWRLCAPRIAASSDLDGVCISFPRHRLRLGGVRLIGRCSARVTYELALAERHARALMASGLQSRTNALIWWRYATASRMSSGASGSKSRSRSDVTGLRQGESRATRSLTSHVARG
jgi:hypothetical protein